jgi:hypothetical protein
MDHRRFIPADLSDPDRRAKAFQPLGAECRWVQFNTPQSEETLGAFASLMEGRPDVGLYVYGGVKDLEFLRLFPRLRTLQLAVWDIEDISGFRHLTEAFHTLTFSQTKARFSLRFLGRMGGLRDLFLQGHTKDFDVVPTLTRLRSLGLHGVRLTTLETLTPLRGLTTLRLGFGNPVDLSALPRFERLEAFKLMRLAKLPAVDALAEASSLRSIDLDWLTHVTRLPDLSRLTALDVLRLDTLKALGDIAGAAAAPALRRLSVGAAPALTAASFQPFVGHPSLSELHAYLGRTRENEAIRRMFPGIAR